uniref:Isochorismatase-like domain-containing protein n=1 Tax=Tetradesmus obliquus TaxID=3088 RepID=A0A383VYH0_TETOB|eukprot:jgi/Sobl393_1/13436/SZX69980.1
MLQVDFCGKGGYVDCMGYDISLTRAPIEPIKRVLAACRAGGFTVMHTREGHRPDLSDLPANKHWRSKQIGAAIGEAGPSGSRLLVRGEPGWEIIEELAPLEGEVVIDKPGKGSFCATDLDLMLRCRGIRNIILAGVTTDVCVHTTMREANDRGYECLLLTDCTAATDPANHAAAISMVQKQGGVFGAVADSTALMHALTKVSSSKSSPAAAQPNGLDTASAAASVPARLPASVPASVPARDVTVEVPAQPYAYSLPLRKAALVMIDFQKDFLCEGGFGGALGNDLSHLQACLPPAAKLLAACRAAGIAVVHTMEAHKADLSDLHPAKACRGNLPEELRIGAVGAMGRILIRGEPGNGIVDEVAPIEGEKLLYKPGKGAFYATDLEPWLHSRGISHLLIAGVTTEVCVQTTMREANDRGFECLLVSDATGSYIPAFKAAVLQMVTAQGGIVGWTANADTVAAALSSS